MKLSIVICVYNTDISYLDKCLKSITYSTLESIENDYEIVLIDDGSVVDYSELLKKYSVKYLKTENRGILSARATGVKEASGKYVAFCDSDDTLSFNYYLPMLEKAEETGAQIVINDWATHTYRARYIAVNDSTICDCIDVSGNETLLKYVENQGREHSYFVLWNKLYEAELLKKSFNLTQLSGIPKNMSYSEDVIINFFAWKHAKRIVNVHTGYYFYRIHSAQSVNAISAEKLKMQISNMSATLSVMMKNIGDDPNKSKIERCIKEWGALMARSHYSVAFARGCEDLYGYILKSYGVEKNVRSTAYDGAVYENKRLLGENFTEIDDALFLIWKSIEPVRVKHFGRNKYVDRSIEYLSAKGLITGSKSAPVITIPKAKISIKSRLIHNRTINRLGLIFFKKGSKSREFLKKFL